MLLYVLNGLYLVIWAALLIHCLQQQRFYPIIGCRWETKIFWLFTFVFFNPLLSLLYIIFGIALRPAKSDEGLRPVHFGSFAAIICAVIVIVLFEVPLGRYKACPYIILSEKENNKSGSISGFGPYIGMLRPTNKIQTYCSEATGTDAKVSLDEILIICDNSNPFLDRAVREFQKSLFGLPYVGKVSYYSSEEWPEQGGRLPDVYIVIDMPEFSEKELFHGRSLSAKIKWRAGSSLFSSQSYSYEGDSCPAVMFDIESEISHVSTMLGLESPGAKYRLEAKNIAGELMRAITKQFDDLLDKYGLMPQLPEMLYGSYRQPPEFSFIVNGDIRLMISGNGLFKDNDTIWQFADERSTEDALNAYYEELKSLDWMGEQPDRDSLEMKKGGERIHIYRRRKRQSESGMIVSGDDQQAKSEASMVAHYQLCWSEERTQKVMGRLLDDDTDIKTLLALESSFKTADQRERLYSIIEQSPVPSLAGYLVQTRYLLDQNEPERGREMLMLARAMQSAEKRDNVKAQEIENLAEKLGDESLAEVEIGEEFYRKTGYINAGEMKEQITRQMGPGEPLMFYRSFDDEGIQTLALRIVSSHEPLSAVSYKLLAVEKRRGISSASEKDGTLASDGKWHAETDIYSLTDEDKYLHLKIESLDDEKFRFVVTKISN